MEVTPEIYAWLVNIKILDGNKSIKMKADGNITIPDNLVRSMMEGFFFEKILANLQEGYNNFYKIKLNYTDRLSDLKLERPEHIDYLPLNLRNSNWNIISEVLTNFGIEISKRKIEKIISGNIDELHGLLNTIYSLSSELVRKSIDHSTTLNSSMVNNGKTEKKSQSNSQAQSKNLNIQNLSLQNSLQKSNIIPNNNDTIDLNIFDVNKEYSMCQSPLEFLIITLCKIFSMKPRQSVALLSNNRKYLRHICNKGIKGDFEKISQWYYEISTNMKVFTNLLRSWKNGRAVGFATISVGLYSKNYQISLKAYNLLAQLLIDIGTDWDWFCNEGILALVFCINKHEDLRVNLINLIYDFSKKNLKELNDTLNLKLIVDNNSEKLLEFLGSIVNCVKMSDNFIYIKFREYILTSCIKETTDISAAISILSDAWINFYPLDKHFTNGILSHIKNAIRLCNTKGFESNSTKRSVPKCAVINLFRIMRRFRETKKEDAAVLYKSLVFLFLENYEINELKEIFLIHFTDFYKKDKSISIKVLVDPYLRQIKTTSTYELSDLRFLNFIVQMDYMRVDIEIIKQILDFVLNISKSEIRYNKCACNILNIILDKYFDLEKNLNSKLDEDFVKICVNHILSTLEIYFTNIRNFPKKFDLSLLESLYYIISLNNSEINKHVHDEIVEVIKYFRGEFNSHSTGLLSLLWFYEDHDEVLLNLEEKFADRNEFIEEYIEEKKVKKPPKKVNPQADIEKIKNKKIQREIQKLEEDYENQLRDAKIKTNLQKKLEQKSFELGISGKSGLNSGNSITQHRNGNLINNSEIDSNMTMIVKEGSIINYNLNLSNLSKDISYRNFLLPIALEDEEDREVKAVRGLTKEFHKEIKFYFNNYLTELNDTITKANFLRMLRDLGIGNEFLTLDELTVSVRNLFGAPLNYFNKEQFVNLLIQISYLVINKINKILTISECFREILMKLKIPNNITKDHKLKKILKIFEEKLVAAEYSKNDTNVYDKTNSDESESINKLKQKSENSDKNDENNQSDSENLETYQNENQLNSKFKLLPPGFNQINKYKVSYCHELHKSFLKFLPESKFLCVEILNEIIHNSIGSNILEPFVKIEKTLEISVDPIKSKHKKWSIAIFNAFTELDNSLFEQSSDTADILEDMLRAIEKGSTTLNKEKNLKPLEKFDMETHQKLIEEDKIKEKKRQLRIQFIKKNLELKQKEKEEEIKEKEEKLKLQRVAREKKLKQQLIEEKNLRSMTLEKIKNSKREKEEEKEKREREEKEKREETERKKEAEREKFLSKQKRKIREQFKKIKTVKQELTKRQKENFDSIFKIPKDKTFQSVISEKEKFYGEFEKNLNTKLEQILTKNEEIKTIMEKYENHLNLIFYIYYKIGMRLGNYPDEIMFFNEFKEFCVNFTIVSLLISKEQMQYIFFKICKRNDGEGDVQNFFRYKDFLLSIFYISIFSKFSDKKTKITPSDLDKVNAEELKIFFDFLGFNLPFNKKEVEEFINDRRALSAKGLMKLKNQLKKEKVKFFKKNSETDGEENVMKNNFVKNRNLSVENESNAVRKNKKNEKQENLDKESNMNLNMKAEEKLNFSKVRNNLPSDNFDNLNMALVDFKEKENSRIHIPNTENVMKISIKNPNGKKEEWKVKN